MVTKVCKWLLPSILRLFVPYNSLPINSNSFRKGSFRFRQTQFFAQCISSYSIKRNTFRSLVFWLCKFRVQSATITRKLSISNMNRYNRDQILTVLETNWSTLGVSFSCGKYFLALMPSPVPAFKSHFHKQNKATRPWKVVQKVTWRVFDYVHVAFYYFYVDLWDENWAVQTILQCTQTKPLGICDISMLSTWMASLRQAESLHRLPHNLHRFCQGEWIDKG